MSRPLPRFTQTALIHDPLEIMLAQRQAQIDRARQEIAAGVNHADATDRERLRGIPCEGFGGTIRGTDPQWDTLHRHRLGR